MKPKHLPIEEVIEVTTERLAYGGEAVARHEGLTVFIRGAAPNERVRARITEKKKNFARAVVEEVLVASADRREPPCKYFGVCGGCQLQHVSYTAQLEAKVGFIRDSLRRIGRIDWGEEIGIHSAAEFGYRSRAQLKINAAGDNKAVGYFKSGSHHVCDVESCLVLAPELNEALATIRTAVKEHPSAPQRTVSEIELVASNKGVAATPIQYLEALGLQEHLLTPEVERYASGFHYRLHPSSFFQVNDLLLEEFIRTAVGNETGELAADLYAGVGLFTLPLSRQFGQVIGVESDGLAVEYAEKNLLANGVTNATVCHSRVGDWLNGLLRRSSDAKPDFILLDPPRSGAAEALEPITRLAPDRLTYVSCDPTTLARDLRFLADNQYTLTRVVAFDFFPQTYHVETVATLERMKKP